MTYQAWITCENHFMSRQYVVFWIRRIQWKCTMPLYTAKQVNISICWFSKELKPNEWIQRVEAAIIKEQMSIKVNLLKIFFYENKDFINPQLLQKVGSKVYYIWKWNKQETNMNIQILAQLIWTRRIRHTESKGRNGVTAWIKSTACEMWVPLTQTPSYSVLIHLHMLEWPISDL